MASLGVTAGLLLDIVGVDAWMHRVPESTPTISASDASRRVRGPADRSSSSTRPGGHTERYSPPGPNWHSGSILLIRYISILATLNAFRSSNGCPIDTRPIGRALQKTQTKTEQIPPGPSPFCARPPTGIVVWSYMGLMTQNSRKKSQPRSQSHRDCAALLTPCEPETTACHPLR